MIHKTKLALWGLLLIALVASACNYPGVGEQPPANNPPPQFSPFPTVTPVYRPTGAATSAVVPSSQMPTPTLATAPTAAVTLTEAPAPSRNIPHTLWLDPALPNSLREALKLPEGWQFTDRRESAALQLMVGNQNPVSEWFFALVAPFPTVVNNISTEEFMGAWQGNPSGTFKGKPLLMGEQTYNMLAAWFGEPASGAVQVLPAEKLLDKAWKQRPSWGIVPFERLEPQWKVLGLGGEKPIHKSFNAETYRLRVPVSLLGDEAVIADLEAAEKAGGEVFIPNSNRDTAKMTIVALTGVTALVRATAYTMEQRGIKYPARDVGAILKSADITHISNEVPFAKNCPFPNPMQQSMKFCSDPRYIKLLEAVGTDVVELTGDHFQDWGNKAMLYTLELYQKEGWYYYGGGKNSKDAKQPALIEHNGNKIAFVGCNGKGGSFAQAGKNSPGAIACKGDWMLGVIKNLRAKGYLPIVTFQHFEYYTYKAQPNQKRDFRNAAKAGAVVVSGSQAHQPQGMEFLGDAFIHYGLGNLFFDQYDVSSATRQAFIDLHVFYEGRYISTELIPVLFVDYARLRPMNQKESKRVLKAVFSASGW